MRSGGEKMRILVIRFSALGDVILTTPVLAALKRKYPHSEIHYAVKKQFSAILEDHPHIDALHELEKGQSVSSFAAAMPRQFDLVVDLHNRLRSLHLRLKLKSSQTLVFRKPYLKRWVLLYLRRNLFREVVPITVQYLRALAPLGIPADNVRPVYRAVKPAAKLPAGPFIALAPGARWFNKRWPAEKFTALIALLSEQAPKARFVLVGGPDETEVAEKIKAALKPAVAAKVSSLTGKLTPRETGYVLSRSEAVITNDSAVIHMASAFPVPVLALFLSTVPEFGFIPFPQTGHIISADLNCRPCDHKGLDHCPKKHFQCAELISAAQVTARLRLAVPYLFARKK